MELITSRLLSVPHGFSTRGGGVSSGPFATLNTATSVGDEAAAVAENQRRLAAAARVERIFTVSQVHGDRVLATPVNPTEQADALWSAQPGTAVGVRTADCVPILIEDPVGRRVAAVHAGWKGTLSEIVSRTVEALVKQGSVSTNLRVAIGPCIQACCFEVSGDLPERFVQAFTPAVKRLKGDRVHLDLPFAVRRSLLASGVPDSAIDQKTECTACDPARFFSHRRDHGITGRHLSFISCLFDDRAVARGANS